MPCLKGWRGLFEERLECRDQRGVGERRGEESGGEKELGSGVRVLLVGVRCFACGDDAAADGDRVQ